MREHPAYVYWVTYTGSTDRQHYIGCRKPQSVTPDDDIGVRYFTSQRGEDGFRELMTTHPRSEFHIHIVSTHPTYLEAQLAEAALMREVDAVHSPKFFNRAMFSDDAIRVLQTPECRARMSKPRKRTEKMGRYERTAAHREAAKVKALAMNTPEANAKKSQSHKGKPSPMLGHTQTAKQRAAVAESNRRRAHTTPPS